MKYAFIIPDGMGDYAIDALNGKTPIEAANTPFMDQIAMEGTTGVSHTTPEGLPPGSDVCILSLLGFNPADYYTGRAPFEAASLGIPLSPADVVMRCNLIHIDEQECISDHSAGHITTEEAKIIIQDLAHELGNNTFQFFPGVSYRHILIWREKLDFQCDSTPPHDVPGNPFKDHLPRGKDASVLEKFILKSRMILKDHPVNLKRAAEGKKTANSIWLWGTGYKPALPPFKERFGTHGGVISAVDLVRGLAKILQLDVIDVPGITGYFDTDYQAKGQYAVAALEKSDFVMVHVEAPDEAGHAGLADEKVKALENIDKHVVGPVWEALKAQGEYRILISPDHYTPVSTRTHVGDPVPFALCGSGIQSKGMTYSEKNSRISSLEFKQGFKLMPYFLNGPST